ncbi:hypothetical protein ROZALSC1DRAFT_25264 [Rozella allomycis CSF55]|uniref:Uncharacterized protein n=1 Tax=Rozella allomycis (strain CSF55) TaxID=988480 RepID=A0A4P9YE12_ROZAC|nr:hypothetical protein ROZALSC1DRAFT_25264 [Rozella allomycis CSF55]
MVYYLSILSTVGSSVMEITSYRSNHLSRSRGRFKRQGIRKNTAITFKKIAWDVKSLVSIKNLFEISRLKIHETENINFKKNLGMNLGERDQFLLLSVIMENLSWIVSQTEPKDIQITSLHQLKEFEMFNGKFEKYQYIQDPIFKEFPLFLGERKRSEQCVPYEEAALISDDVLRIVVDKSLINNYNVFCLEKIHTFSSSEYAGSMDVFDLKSTLDRKATDLYVTKEIIIFRKVRFQNTSDVEFGAYIYDEYGRTKEINILCRA